MAQCLTSSRPSPRSWQGRPSLQPELLTGEGELLRWSPAASGPIYGWVASVVEVPAKLGHTRGSRPVYHDALITWYVDQRLANSAQMAIQLAEQQLLEQVFGVHNLTGSRIGFRTLPGVVFAVSYLRLS